MFCISAASPRNRDREWIVTTPVIGLMPWQSAECVFVCLFAYVCFSVHPLVLPYTKLKSLTQGICHLEVFPQTYIKKHIGNQKSGIYQLRAFPNPACISLCLVWFLADFPSICTKHPIHDNLHSRNISLLFSLPSILPLTLPFPSSLVWCIIPSLFFL